MIDDELKEWAMGLDPMEVCRQQKRVDDQLRMMSIWETAPRDIPDGVYEWRIRLHSERIALWRRVDADRAAHEAQMAIERSLSGV